MADRELTYESAFPSRFMKAELFDGKSVTLTIEKIYQEGLEGEKGKEEKIIAAFKGTARELVLCKTNAFCVKEMFGSKMSKWAGKRVVLYPTTCHFGPKLVACIRVSGSPDIASDIEVSARIGRKTFKATMKATKGGAAPLPVPEPTPEPAGEETDYAAYANEDDSPKDYFPGA